MCTASPGGLISSSLMRLVQFGYRTPELRHSGYLGDPPPTAQSLRIKYRAVESYDGSRRFPAAVAVGPYVEGLVLPRPDLVDPPTVVDGIRKRFGHAPPTPDEGLMAEFLQFTKGYVRNNFRPLDLETDFGLETWLASTNYPEWRREELRVAHSNALELLQVRNGLKRIRRVGSFGKSETYPEWKFLRPINARSDEYKVLVGPAFRQIEKVVFAHHSFIKKVPRLEWPDHIIKYLTSGYFVYTSDYSSFESLFEELMDAELSLYEWMLQYHPEQLEWVRMIDDENECYFKHVIAKVWRKRMSGEMNTSLGNGFTTHVVAKFIVDRLYGRDCIILQEGDDTIFCSPGPLDEELFEKLGLEVKLERVTDVSRGQFCQLIFDESDRTVVRDPIPYVVGFSWIEGKHATTTKHDEFMLVARAMSCLAQYPGHPVLQEFASYILRCVDYKAESVVAYVERSRDLDTYQREVYLRAAVNFDKVLSRRRPVTMATRIVVEEQFGLGVEHQLLFERYFQSCNSIKPIPVELFGDLGHSSWAECWKLYVRLVNVRATSWDQVTVGPLDA